MGCVRSAIASKAKATCKDAPGSNRARYALYASSYNYKALPTSTITPALAFFRSLTASTKSSSVSSILFSLY